MQKIRFFPLLLLLLALFCSLAFADQITLKSGDRLTGKIVATDEGSITLETEFAGLIKVDAKLVDSVFVSSLPKPETAVAKATEMTENKQAAAEVVPEKKVAAIKPAKLTPVVRGLFEGDYFGLFSNWDGNADIGFSYTTGNTKTTTLVTGIRAVKSGKDDNLTIYFRSLWNDNRKIVNSRITSNAVWGGIRFDRRVNEKLFGFVAYDFERDRPKKLNFRSVVGGGAGYHAVKDERTEWDLLLGGAWNRAWQVGQNTNTPEVLLGSSIKHRFTDRFKVQKTFSFYQDAAFFRRYRFIFDATVSADVTKRIGWYVTLGDRFNNYPIGGVEKNDVLFTTGIKWSFGKKK